MKRCEHCGGEYADHVRYCFLDHHPLVPSVPPEAVGRPLAPPPRLGALRMSSGVLTTAFVLIVLFLLAAMVFSPAQALTCLLGLFVCACVGGCVTLAMIRNNQETENELAKDDRVPFGLLLRPFVSDERQQVRDPYDANRTTPLSTLLAEATRPEYQLRALGGEPVGPGIVYIADPVWRPKFHHLAGLARGIMVLVMPGKEIPWELTELRRHRWLHKTIFLLPPQDVFWDENSRAFLKRLRMTGFDLPLPEESYLAVVLDPDGRCVEATPLRPLNHTSIRRVLEKRWQREKAGPSV